MPKLDDAKRKSIRQRLDLHQLLRDGWKNRQYHGAQCRLCNWTSNGLTSVEAWELNKAHETTHPELQQIWDTPVSMEEVRDSLHDHDCVMAKCACKCGCQSGPFCTLLIGPLCPTCFVAANRGYDEHGEEEAE